MNAAQEKFLSFIMDRVQNEKKNEAEAILQESFAKQDDGSFNAAYLAGIAPKLAAALKPEFVGELKTAINRFGASSAASGMANKLSGGALGSLFGGEKK